MILSSLLRIHSRPHRKLGSANIIRKTIISVDGRGIVICAVSSRRFRASDQVFYQSGNIGLIVLSAFYFSQADTFKRNNPALIYHSRNENLSLTFELLKKPDLFITQRRLSIVGVGYQESNARGNEGEDKY